VLWYLGNQIRACGCHVEVAQTCANHWRMMMSQSLWMPCGSGTNLSQESRFGDSSRTPRLCNYPVEVWTSSTPHSCLWPMRYVKHSSSWAHVQIGRHQQARSRFLISSCWEVWICTHLLMVCSSSPFWCHFGLFDECMMSYWFLMFCKPVVVWLWKNWLDCSTNFLLILKRCYESRM
jgi:hypothetical protein